MEMKTDFPNHGHAILRVQTAAPAKFKIAVRVPVYAEDCRLAVDQQSISLEIQKGYAIMEQVWSGTSIIEINFEMPVKIMRCDPQVRANIGKGAIVKGPLVYCLEQTDNFENLAAVVLDENAELTEFFDQTLLDGVTVIQTTAMQADSDSWNEGLYAFKRPQYKPVTIRAVPYYLWGNRTPGEMIVWLNVNVL